MPPGGRERCRPPARLDTGGGECLALAATSPLMPTAAATTSRRPSASTARTVSVERSALRALGVPTRWPWCTAVTSSTPASVITSNACRSEPTLSASIDGVPWFAGRRTAPSGSAVRPVWWRGGCRDVLDAGRRRLATTIPWPLAAGADEASAAVLSGGSTRGVSQSTGCDLTSRIAASRSCNGMSCGSSPRPPRRASTATMQGRSRSSCSRRRAATSPVPSCRRDRPGQLVTADLRGTRKTSGKVRSTVSCSPGTSCLHGTRIATRWAHGFDDSRAKHVELVGPSIARANASCVDVHLENFSDEEGDRACRTR